VSRTGAAIARSRAGAGVAAGGAVTVLGVVRGAVVVRAGAGARSVGGVAGRVTVPLIVKSRSSPGPTVSGGGAWVFVAGASVFWASAGADPKIEAATNAAMPKRLPALMSSVHCE
jgi:hypothetical protein